MAITRPEELLARLGLPAGGLGAVAGAVGEMPVRVPLGFVARMRRGDPMDPLLRQVLPVAEESRVVPGFGHDPLAESAAAAAPGLLHKYRGRVLLVVTGACGIHCRYCFRRHFPYDDAGAGRDGWDEAIEYVRSRPDVAEVILSGGDPLAASDRRLGDLVTAIEAIPHVRRLRLHTRMPVVLPERVDDALVGWLGATRLRTVVVVHANHPNEVDATVEDAFGRLTAAGATLLNQSVLLAGVNDDARTLAALSERLFEAGVLPYYLHQLDAVAGAAHFAVDDGRARAIAAALSRELPGYLVPRLVREIPGAVAKVPLDLESELTVRDLEAGSLRKLG